MPEFKCLIKPCEAREFINTVALEQMTQDARETAEFHVGQEDTSLMAERNRLMTYEMLQLAKVLIQERDGAWELNQ